MIINSWFDGVSIWMYWLVEQGYLVFMFDNCGLGECGVVFEIQIYCEFGIVEIQDQMSGVDYLKLFFYVDVDCLVVYGWSFGGFMIIFFMFKKVGIFNVGVVGGLVIDWKYYEVMYGECYMDCLEQNEKGYEEVSLFIYVDKLKGKLLLIYGIVDDVVVMQYNFVFVKCFVDLGIQMDFFFYLMYKYNVIGKDCVYLMIKVLNYVIENNYK